MTADIDWGPVPDEAAEVLRPALEVMLRSFSDLGMLSDTAVVLHREFGALTPALGMRRRKTPPEFFSGLVDSARLNPRIVGLMMLAPMRLGSPSSPDRHLYLALDLMGSRPLQWIAPEQEPGRLGRFRPVGAGEVAGFPYRYTECYPD